MLSGVIKNDPLLHSNAHLHTTASLHQLNLILKHFPHGHHLAFTDYHQFGPLKDTLRYCRYASDHEVKEAVHVWLVTQPKTFSSMVM
jgi:hypothetical protein